MGEVAYLDHGPRTSETVVDLRQEGPYRFAIRFGPAIPLVHSDEPEPLGHGTGPSPVQLLAAAVGNCLSDSLVFALRKFHQTAEPITTAVYTTVGRNEQNRLRVQFMHVRLTLNVPSTALEYLDRILDRFEEYCTVTQTVRQAFPVHVEILDAEGVRLK